jgi:hypothetical protein
MAIKKRSTTKPSRKRTREEESSSHDKDHSSSKSKAPANRQRKQQRGRDNANTQLRVGVGVVVLAILVGYMWNLFDSSDPLMINFFSQACRYSATCAAYVSTTRRTLQAARPVRPGESLVQIPREIQFWDLDALRDEFVAEHLLEARHRRSRNLLPSGAFLAAWLAMLVKNVANETNVVRKSYLEVLPTMEDLLYHPIFWDKTELRSSLGAHSLNYAVARNYQEMVESEYDAFVGESSEFGELINATEYRVARVNVLTRSFSPGPVGIEEDLDTEELESYKDKMGIDFSKGCHAMVPILDMLNHHPNPNVVYNYNKEKRVFVISAKRMIPSGWELMDSYGKFSDSHLFSKFGFLNGDGSGFSFATIAMFHRALDYEMKDQFSVISLNSDTDRTVNKAIFDYQRREMRRYLQYDDGYKECIDPEKNPEAFHLKQLKLQHLLATANDSKRWTVKASPRAPKSEPVEASDVPITEEVPDLDARNIRMDYTALVSNCRLMSLIESDLDGRAVEVLAENLVNEKFLVEKSNDALEFRALMWYVDLWFGVLRMQCHVAHGTCGPFY